MPTRLIEAVREFTNTVLNPYDLPDLLHRLTRHATTALDAEGAGIMLEDDNGRLAFAAASSERIAGPERLQAETHRGPCQRAFQHAEMVVVEDIREGDRWAEYQPYVESIGLASVVATPLRVWGQTIGVMDVFMSNPGPWPEADLEACELLAAMGAGYILNATRSRADRDWETACRRRWSPVG